MNVFHGMLFLHGHIADPELARSLARSKGPVVAAQIATRKPDSRPSRLRWLVEELVLLGGRPVSREHLDDLEEPFPPLHPCG